jgi:hypothetical protein
MRPCRKDLQQGLAVSAAAVLGEPTGHQAPDFYGWKFHVGASPSRTAKFGRRIEPIVTSNLEWTPDQLAERHCGLLNVSQALEPVGRSDQARTAGRRATAMRETPQISRPSRSSGRRIEVEITANIARQRKLRIYELGITYYGRSYDEGKKINWKDGLKALWYLVKFRFA